MYADSVVAEGAFGPVNPGIVMRPVLVHPITVFARSWNRPPFALDTHMWVSRLRSRRVNKGHLEKCLPMLSIG